MVKIELSTEEQDASAVVIEATETSRIGFDHLDFGVQPLGHRIGNRMLQIS